MQLQPEHRSAGIVDGIVRKVVGGSPLQRRNIVKSLAAAAQFPQGVTSEEVLKNATRPINTLTRDEVLFMSAAQLSNLQD